MKNPNQLVQKNGRYFSLRKILIFNSRFHLSTFLAMVFLFLSCSKQQVKIAKNGTGPGVNHGAAARDLSYTDKDVFKGVMFLDGPVADAYLADFSGLSLDNLIDSQSVRDSVRDIQDSVVMRIFNADNDYLNNFRTAIGSSDYTAVKDAIEAANEAIFEQMSNITGAHPTEQDMADLADEFIDENNLSSSSSLNDFKTAVENQPYSFNKPTVDAQIRLKVMMMGYIAIVIAILIMMMIPYERTVGPFYQEEFTAAITDELVDI